MNIFKNKRIYLDYAAATPVRKEVVDAMYPFWNKVYANPSAIHKEGVEAKRAVENAREKVATTLRVRVDDIIFTSGGTESNNLILRGAISAMKSSGIKMTDIEILSTEVEHPSITKVLSELKQEGCVVTYLPVDKDGLIIFSEFTKRLSPKTRLVSIAYANSETGVVQDIGKLSRAVRAFEKENGLSIIFHTDASQAPMWLPCALDALGVDAMTLDAGKCEGPKGIGILVSRPKVKLSSINFGGSQESGMRPGTEPVPLVVGAALALELAQHEYKEHNHKISLLRDRWIKTLKEIEGVVINGSLDHRLPNNINISITGFDSEFAVVTLDTAGISASTKSACAGAGSGKSTVVFAMTGDLDRSTSTIRFTLSPRTKWSELKKTTKILKSYLEKARDFKLIQQK